MNDYAIESLPPMPFSEIAPHYRRRDWLLFFPWLWSAASLFCGIVWRVQDVAPDGRAFRMPLTVAWSIAFGLCGGFRGELFSAALDRACRARGYQCVPFNLRYQEPRP